MIGFGNSLLRSMLMINISLYNWWLLNQVPHHKQAEDPYLDHVKTPGQYQGVREGWCSCLTGRPAVTTMFWEEVVRMENVL
jgi:hypothetical protein